MRRFFPKGFPLVRLSALDASPWFSVLGGQTLVLDALVYSGMVLEAILPSIRTLRADFVFFFLLDFSPCYFCKSEFTDPIKFKGRETQYDKSGLDLEYGK